MVAVSNMRPFAARIITVVSVLIFVILDVVVYIQATLQRQSAATSVMRLWRLQSGALQSESLRELINSTFGTSFSKIATIHRAHSRIPGRQWRNNIKHANDDEHLLTPDHHVEQAPVTRRRRRLPRRVRPLHLHRRSPGEYH